MFSTCVCVCVCVRERERERGRERGRERERDRDRDREGGKKTFSQLKKNKPKAPFSYTALKKSLIEKFPFS